MVKCLYAESDQGSGAGQPITDGNKMVNGKIKYKAEYWLLNGTTKGQILADVCI